MTEAQLFALAFVMIVVAGVLAWCSMQPPRDEPDRW